MIRVQNLCFEYAEQPILENCSFSVAAGELFYVYGENGRGKSTLLKLLAGLLFPESSSIFYKEKPISDVFSDYQRDLCYVGHKNGISPQLTVEENARYSYHSDKNLTDALSLFGLTDLAKTPCDLLSAGLKRRVALLRLLQTNALIWLLDEPFNTLDRPFVTILAHVIKQQLQRGGTVIMTSHLDIAPFFQQYTEFRL